MPITLTDSSASISTTEYFLNAGGTTASYNTTDTVLQVVLDFVNMVAGDSYEVKIYDKIDGTNARVLYHVILEGAQSTPLVTPSIVLGNWEVSVKRLAGADRTIYWSLRKLT